jgi:hypothetical protein
MACMLRKPSFAKWCSYGAVAIAVLFVLRHLQVNLLLANTTPSGGDMGAHVWAPAYLRDHLLPHGRLTGWTPDWYAGFPALTFYFPLPSLLIVVLDVVLPYGVAFKLVTVLGLLALPVACYVFGRLIGLRGPTPACLAVLSVPFLFERSYTIYGGNIPSTLAGEFSFSISLAVAVLFLGVFARGLQTGRQRGLAAVLLAITGLCHFIPTFFAIGGAVILVLMNFDKKRLRYAVPVAIVGGMVGAFWWLPFFMRLPYTTDMGWERLTTYHTAMFPKSLEVPLILAALGAATSFVLRRRGGIFLSLLVAGSAMAFLFMPQTRLWNARLLPFWFLSVYLLAGVGVAVMGEAVSAVVGYLARRPPDDSLASASDDYGSGEYGYATNGYSNGYGAGNGHAVSPSPIVATAMVPTVPRTERSPGEVFVLAVTPLAAAVVFLTAVALPLKTLPKSFPIKTADSSFIPGWVKWNYEGYERKTAYPEYRDIINTMKTVGRDHGCGRASWEYEPELDRYGTPMALMLLPHWTDGCIGSMEGLYFESSATTPYHFLSNSELSLRPPRPQRDLPYRDLDVKLGVQHLQLMGVRYYMTLSEAAQSQARVNPDLKLVGRSGEFTNTITESGKPAESKTRAWEIYEVANSAIVAPLTNEPVVMTGVPKGGPEWQAAAVSWFQGDPSRWEVPLAASGPKEWARVRGADAEPPHRAVQPATVSKIEMKDDRVSFDVDRIGSPVLVKTSYFPNWQAKGAQGPWRVTPNAMVVIPTSKHVTLHYGETPVDIAGWALTYLGIFGIVIISRRPLLEGDDDDANSEGDPDLFARDADGRSALADGVPSELQPQPA